MKILVVAATRAELTGLFTAFGILPADFVQTPKFDVLVTGVGMTATAFALGQRLPAGYQLVLNLGIAGCYDRSIPLGSVLNIVTDEFSELGAENGDGFLSIKDLGFGEAGYAAKYDPRYIELTSLKKSKGITVNTVHGNTQSIAAIVKRVAPGTESMEGAAVFYCCYKTGTPCIQIRSISNYVEERNRDSWEIGLAIKNLNSWAIEFLTKA
jgi:futalosine hydrolase